VIKFFLWIGLRHISPMFCISQNRYCTIWGCWHNTTVYHNMLYIVVDVRNFQLEDRKPRGEPHTARSFYLAQYGRSLMSDSTLWQLAPTYITDADTICSMVKTQVPFLFLLILVSFCFLARPKRPTCLEIATYMFWFWSS